MIEIEVYKALDHELLQLLIASSGFIYQLDLLLELVNIRCFELLVVYASLELLMDDLIGESTHWRGEMSIKVKAQSEVPLVNVEIARVDGILLDVHGLVDQQLLEALIKLFLLEELFELFFKMHHVVSFELDS